MNRFKVRPRFSDSNQSNDIKEAIIQIPTLKEQWLFIGAYFSNLDSLINSHQENFAARALLKKKSLQIWFLSFNLLKKFTHLIKRILPFSNIYEPPFDLSQRALLSA